MYFIVSVPRPRLEFKAFPRNFPHVNPETGKFQVYFTFKKKSDIISSRNLKIEYMTIFIKKVQTLKIIEWIDLYFLRTYMRHSFMYIYTYVKKKVVKILLKVSQYICIFRTCGVEVHKLWLQIMYWQNMKDTIIKFIIFLRINYHSNGFFLVKHWSK